MDKGINKAIIVGNLGNDPETFTFPDGGMKTEISVATTETWKDKQSGQQQSRTEWHKITFTGKLAEIAADYLRKGAKVYIEGLFRTRKWQDKQTGQDRYSTEIVGRTMQMLDSRNDNQQNNGGYQNQNQNDNAYQPQKPIRRQQRQQPQQRQQQQPQRQQPQDPHNPPVYLGEFDDGFDDDIPF